MNVAGTHMAADSMPLTPEAVTHFKKLTERLEVAPFSKKNNQCRNNQCKNKNRNFRNVRSSVFQK
jgi:hypothetical protein